MSQTTDDRIHWTSADLELFPDNGNRYEIIDGELFVTRAPNWGHQKACLNLAAELRTWSLSTELGEAVIAPGVVYTDEDNVIPDVVWVSKERLPLLLDDAGHLTGSPELVVEVLSPGTENERRDKKVKLKLYSARGVQEYWILSWQLQQVEVYRRQDATLKVFATLLATDELSSPLLPGFVCPIGRLFV
jgi:Uma2 family endonuclease